MRNDESTDCSRGRGGTDLTRNGERRGHTGNRNLVVGVGSAQTVEQEAVGVLELSSRHLGSSKMQGYDRAQSGEFPKAPTLEPP